MALLKENECYIVGTLVEVKELKEVLFGPNKDKEGVSAKIVVKSVVNDVENLIELTTFISKVTKAGTINKNYNTILGLNDLLNTRVVVSGATIESERFWAKNTNQLVQSTKYRFNIIRPASSAQTEDKAEFKFGGFVYRELAEKLDENGEIMYYQFSLAQANYKEDNIFIVDFVVPKNNLAAVNAIQKMYEQGATVEVSGICQNVVSISTTTEDVAFGDPIVRTHTRTDRKLIITSGQQPITGEGEYTIDSIKALNEAYTREGIAIKDKASASANDATQETVNKPSKKSALAGLI